MDYSDPQMHRDEREEPSYAEGWAASRIVCLPDLDHRITSVVEACDWQKSLIGQFVLDLAPPVDLFFRRNLIDSTTFFRDFFSHPAVVEQIPNLGQLECAHYDPEPQVSAWPPSGSQPALPTLGFRRFGAWITTATLAGAISFRGITAARGNPDEKVLQLIREFAEAAFCSRYSGTYGYLSSDAWADWFLGMSDSTYFWFDRQRGLATILLISDSD